MNVKLKWYETTSRYLLGLFYLVGAIDGFMYLVLDMSKVPKPTDIFFTGLIGTTYFWALMKLIQGIGALSLLFNYKPVLGFTLLTPITTVLVLYYINHLGWYYVAAFLVITSALLLKAYSKSFQHLLDKY